MYQIFSPQMMMFFLEVRELRPWCIAEEIVPLRDGSLPSSRAVSQLRLCFLSSSSFHSSLPSSLLPVHHEENNLNVNTLKPWAKINRLFLFILFVSDIWRYLVIAKQNPSIRQMITSTWHLEIIFHDQKISVLSSLPQMWEHRLTHLVLTAWDFSLLPCFFVTAVPFFFSSLDL